MVYSSAKTLSIFVRSSSRRSCPLSFLWAKIGVAQLDNDRTSVEKFSSTGVNQTSGYLFKRISIGLKSLCAAFAMLWYEFLFKLHPQFIHHSLSCKEVMIIIGDIFNCLFFSLESSVSVHPNCSWNVLPDSMLTFEFVLFFVLIHFFFQDMCLYVGMIMNFTRIFGCGEPHCVALLFWPLQYN